jgi:hypothetical protein
LNAEIRYANDIDRPQINRRDSQAGDWVALLACPAVFLRGLWINPALLDEPAVAPGDERRQTISDVQTAYHTCRSAGTYAMIRDGKVLPERGLAIAGGRGTMAVHVADFQQHVQREWRQGEKTPFAPSALCFIS